MAVEDRPELSEEDETATAVTVTNNGPGTVQSPRLWVVSGGEIGRASGASSGCFEGIVDPAVTHPERAYQCFLSALEAGQSVEIVIFARPQGSLRFDHVAVAFDLDEITIDPNWANNVATSPSSGVEECPVDPPPLEEIDLTKRERTEVVSDQRGDRPLSEYIEDLERAIATIEKDTQQHPEHKERNDALIAELQALLDEAKKEQGNRSLARFPASPGLNDKQKNVLKSAGCGGLEVAADSLKEFLKDTNKPQGAELVEKLVILQKLLVADKDEPVLSAERREYLTGTFADLVSRLAKDDLDDGATAKKKNAYKAIADEAYSVLQLYLDPNSRSPEERRKFLERQLKNAAAIFASKEQNEFIDLSFKFVHVIRGDATQEQQFEILKESVANLANRLTTKLFGEAILKTPQARAAMLGFELGKAFGDRIAADLELVFQGTLVDDCTLNLARVQGANGPADVRYNEPTIVTIDSDQYWHKGWACTIVTSGYVDTIAGGVVQAQRPESSTATQSVVWQITTGGKRVVYWDPACAVARACSFAKP